MEGQQFVINIIMSMQQLTMDGFGMGREGSFARQFQGYKNIKTSSPTTKKQINNNPIKPSKKCKKLLEVLKHGLYELEQSIIN